MIYINIYRQEKCMHTPAAIFRGTQDALNPAIGAERMAVVSRIWKSNGISARRYVSLLPGAWPALIVTVFSLMPSWILHKFSDT